MKYFQLSEFGDYGTQGFCYTSERPEGIGAQTYRLAQGIALREYPEAAGEVTLKLDDDHEGLKKGTVLGNDSALLILDRAAKEAVAALVTSDVEFHPFHLLDHKGRVHSKDYFFVNPLLALDCLHRKESEIVYTDNGEIKVVRSKVLDAKKLASAPCLFRIKPIVRGYYINEKLKAALEAGDAGNLIVKEIPVK